MKRSNAEVAEKSSSPLQTTNSKKLKLDATDDLNIVKEFLCDDCVGKILSYLEFTDLFSCLLVCKNWNVLMRSEHVQHFLICYNLQQFFIDKLEERDEWFVKLRMWLTGLSTCIELSSESEIFKTKEMMIDQNFQPFIDFISFEYVKDICMRFEVAVHLEKGILVRLQASLSYSEDEYIYANVESDPNSKFDWSKFDIDPTKKNIIVFRYNGYEEEDSDCLAEEYEVNSQFFKEFSSYFPFDNLLDFLKRSVNFRTRRSYGTRYDIEDEDEKFDGFITKEDLEIRKELLESPILRVAEYYRVTCLDTMLELMERTYSYMISSTDQEIEDFGDNYLQISNVLGVSHVVVFSRKPLHNIHTDFILKSNNKCWKVDFQVQEHFYYGHDGYEGSHLFRLTDCSTQEETCIGGYAYGTNDSVVWEYDGEEQLSDIGIPVGSVIDFIERVLDKLLPQLPCYDPFNGKTASNRSLYFYLKGSYSE